MIVRYLLLLLVLSLETSVGLPLFVVGGVLRELPRRHHWSHSTALIFIGSLALAAFYQLSWPPLALGLWLLWQKHWGWRVAVFVLLQFYIFQQAQLHLHWLFFVHLAVFLLFLYKKNLRKYV